MKLNWTKTNEYLMGKTQNFEFKEKFAIFDLDSTLVTPKIGSKGNGKGFPIDENDWKWQYSNTKSLLKNLDGNEYSIIIISNQGGMAKGKQTYNVWTQKLNQICENLNLNLYVFCSVDYNKYRKPYPTWMYELVPNNIFDIIDRKLSFYCGDAAGRKGDFSDTDYKFAMNCMLKFYTPEGLFLGKQDLLPDIEYPKITKKNVNFDFTPKNKDMIIMVGYPASGKSYIAEKLKNEHGYVIINQDTLKTKQKCTKMAIKLMENNDSLVIDSTNPGITERNSWITLAKSYGYNIRVIEMTTPKEISMHNNYYRHWNKNINLIPKIAYNMFKSKYIKPRLSEEVTEILELECGTPKDPKYYFYLY